jgi:PAS domain S-box-containing protein
MMTPMSRRSLLLLAALLLITSVVLLWFGLTASPRRAIGYVGAGLMLTTVAGLSVALFQEHERLRATRHALARSEVRAQALIEASPDGIVLLDRTRIVFANPSFRTLLSIPPDEQLVGRDFLALVVPAERDAVGRWLTTRHEGAIEPDTMAITGVRLSGADVSLEAASALLPARTGRQVALFLRDQSARDSLESRLRHLERLEALADLGEGLIRDFDRLFLRMRRLARGADAEESGRTHEETLELIERLASRGAAMTRRVQSFVPDRVDRTTHRQFELVRLVRDVCADFLRSIGSDVTLRVIPEPHERMVVLGDPSQVRQAIWQVLQNAREARSDGEIQVRTRRLELDEAEASRVPGSRAGEYALVEVEDSGPGVPEHMRSKIFEPFFSTKGGRASGLGLTITYGTARSHGGFVDLESSAEEGTTLRLALPLVADHDLTGEARASAEDPRTRWRGRETLLMVDDDHGSRSEAVKILEGYGYHVELAATPREALQRLRHRPLVDLVLLDMVLPGWNGPDVLSRILRNWPDQRVLIISPYPLREQEDLAMHRGAAGVYRKPLRDPDLPRAVRSALDRPPPAPPG